MKIPPSGVLDVRVAKGQRTSGKSAISLVFTVPLKCINPLNGREHWRARARRVKAERSAIALAFPHWARGVLSSKRWAKAVVILTMRRPRLFDDDAVPGALKGVRDEVAKQLGVDDADSRIGFVTGQERCPDYAVTVQVERVT